MRLKEIKNKNKAGAGRGMSLIKELPSITSTFEVIHLGAEFHNKGTVLGELNIALDVWP